MQRIFQRFQYDNSHQHQHQLWQDAIQGLQDGDTTSCSSFSSLGDDDYDAEQATDNQVHGRRQQQQQEDASDRQLFEQALQLSLLDSTTTQQYQETGSDDDSFVLIGDSSSMQQWQGKQIQPLPAATETETAMKTGNAANEPQIQGIVPAMSVADIDEGTGAFQSCLNSCVGSEQQFCSKRISTRSNHEDCDDLCYDCLVQANLQYFGAVLDGETGPISSLCHACGNRSQTSTTIRSKAASRKACDAGEAKSSSGSIENVSTSSTQATAGIDDALRSKRNKTLWFNENIYSSSSYPSSYIANNSSSSSSSSKKSTSTQQHTSKRSSTSPFAVKPKKGAIYKKLRKEQCRFTKSSYYNAPQTSKTSIVDQRAPISLYMYNDEDTLSPYECLIRKNLQYYECFDADSTSNVVVGRVGIRCRNCSHTHRASTGSAAIGFPSNLLDIRKVARELAVQHLIREGQCPCISERVRKELMRLRDQHRNEVGNVDSDEATLYWAEAAKVSGIHENSSSSSVPLFDGDTSAHSNSSSGSANGGLSWTSYLPNTGEETRKRFIHKQLTKTTRENRK